jgi:hypothetical protein
MKKLYVVRVSVPDNVTSITVSFGSKLKEGIDVVVQCSRLPDGF